VNSGLKKLDTVPNLLEYTSWEIENFRDKNYTQQHAIAIVGNKNETSLKLAAEGSKLNFNS